ncbi:hypothetical protein [Rhodococcus sp. HNM0569]|uniref:hypothetical protein n=1 Tax=Rhodococcus sp. HNM0569 TaxID=2716340 RepID=UPI001469F160|nr:hypothetical protein [Rhodococcus sp. HNM0569]NLU82561.1 hypothetical protein [Rhodococcus sp. HNM0569]
MASSTRPPRRATPTRIAPSASTAVRARLDDPEPRDYRSLAVVGVSVAVVGAIATALAPVLGAVDDGSVTVVVAAAVWSAVVALTIPALSGIALASGRGEAAGALLAGAGAVSLGLAVLDVQLFSRALDANRFELFRPHTATELSAAAGAYAVVAGHALGVAAGLIGLVVVHRASLGDGYDDARSAELAGRASGGRVGRPLASVVVLAALVVAGALFAPPFASHDPVVLVPAALSADLPVAAGTAVVAVALVVAVAAALASISPVVGSATVVGAGLAALELAGARLVAGVAAGDGVEVGAGTVWATAGAAVLVCAGLAMPFADRARDGAASRRAEPEESDGAADRQTAAEVRRAADAAAWARVHRAHALAGACGIASGALAIGGTFLPLLTVPSGMSVPQILGERVVLVAGAVLAVAGVLLVLSEFARAVRPAVAVLWVSVPASVAAVSQSVMRATDLPGISIGLGAIVLWVACALAAATGLLVAAAGGLEREEVDTSEAVTPYRPFAVVGGLGAVVAVLGFALPLVRGTDARGRDYRSTSFADLPWNIDAWGHVLLAASVAIAVLVAVRSRRARAVALSAGCAAVLVVYLASWPLTRGVVPESTMGPGVVVSGTGLLLLAAATALATRMTDR